MTEITTRGIGDQYRALFEANPLSMWVYDRVTLRILAVNRAAVEQYGYERDDFLGMSLLDIQPCDEGAWRPVAGAVVPEDGEPELRRHRRKDGSMIDVEVVASDLEFDGCRARLAYARDVTNSCRVQERYRQLVERAHDGIWAADAVGSTTYVNARLCEMLGCSPEELIGRSLFDFMTPENAFEARTLYARRKRGIPGVQEITLRRRDGTEFLARASTSPLSEDDEFAGVLTLLTDITDQRRIENALRESQALLASAEELAHVGSWCVDLELDEVTWSDELYRIVGLTPGGARITRAKFIELVHPDDRSRLLAAFDELVLTGDAPSVELRVPMADGTVRVLHARGRVHRNSDGRVTSVVGSVQDVTDRVAATAEIERAHRQLATVIDDAPLAIATVDREGRVTAWNPAAERLFGWNADEVIGKPLPIVPADRRTEFEGVLSDRLQGRGTFGFETRRMKKDGTFVDVELASASVRDAAGNIVGAMGFLADVTARKHLEDQLRQAQKIEAVGQLAGGIAHDFNNIITVIKLHSEFLIESVGPADPRREDVEQVQKAAIRAAGLTRQLLAFSRKQLLQPVVLDLNATVQELDKMVSRLIGADISIEAKLAPDLWRVLADPGQIEQVLINLAVNARDAMPRGGRLSITTQNLELDGSYVDLHPAVAEGRYVMLAVTDTGCGMTREVQSRLWEPFFTTKGPRGGTGLGLSTVYGIVKQSNGYIWVYSEVGQGATFKIYLPAVDATVDSRGSPARTLPAARSSEVVLLVEDEESVRGLARRILARQGYIVLEAIDGRDAIAVAGRYDGRIDIVVTDAVMPGIGGIDLINTMRPLRPDMRVLLMSGYTDDEMVRRGILTPEVTFLAKPFNVEELLRRVRDVLDAELPQAVAG